jgi:hypothetical protein
MRGFGVQRAEILSVFGFGVDVRPPGCVKKKESVGFGPKSWTKRGGRPTPPRAESKEKEEPPQPKDPWARGPANTNILNLLWTFTSAPCR